MIRVISQIGTATGSSRILSAANNQSSRSEKFSSIWISAAAAVKPSRAINDVKGVRCRGVSSDAAVEPSRCHIQIANNQQRLAKAGSESDQSRHRSEREHDWPQDNRCRYHSRFVDQVRAQRRGHQKKAQRVNDRSRNVEQHGRSIARVTHHPQAVARHAIA